MRKGLLYMFDDLEEGFFLTGRWWMANSQEAMADKGLHLSAMFPEPIGSASIAFFKTG